jgi:hypothetical protein
VAACKRCPFKIWFSDVSDLLLLQMEHCRRNLCASFFFSRQWSLLNKNLFANADHSPPLRFTLGKDAGGRAQASSFCDGNSFLKNNS